MVGRLTRMDAMQSQAMAIETERRRDLEIKRIDAALGRIDADEFGYCGICGEPIDTRRLENDPTVVTCITCLGPRACYQKVITTPSCFF